MKIKIITCHDVYNVGASLQAYALETYLMKQGHDVEIIDYKPEYLSRHYRLNVVSNPRYDRPVLREAYLLIKLPGRLAALRSRKKSEFDHFRNRYLKLTQRKYTTNEELKTDPPEADVYIAGSDQIWNPLFQNGRDPSFFLDFVQNGKKVAYAASFAVKELPQDLKDTVKKLLKSFSAIAVREQTGVEIIEELDLSGICTCDPVFLLKKHLDWQVLLSHKNETDKRKPYLFVYDFDDSQVIKKMALITARKDNLEIVSYFKNSYADKVEESGPVTFLDNIWNASVVISNSFHATAFSLLFHKEFYVVGRVDDINTRMEDLLLSVGLQSRYVTNISDLCATEQIDWNSVDRLLEKQVLASKAFLRDLLE